MKTLKLEHHLAELVEQGTKTSTWRLYDDKDLSVNDTVNLIDKVDANDPGTWKVVGTAHIDSIVQKRLGDIIPEDYAGHEAFESHEHMMKTYQKYYGPQVDNQTVVKIIRFTFNNENTKNDSNVVESVTDLTEVKMYADGGSRGNPGPSASGYVVMDMNNRIVVKKGEYIGITTNNQAEYQALKLGLEEVKRMRIRDVHVYMDSLLVVNQMLGIFKVKNRDLWPVYGAVKELVGAFKHVSFTHVPRELNKEADAAVNEVLDAAAES